ncbi:hypothetical protein SAY87_026004 [Trapa incisa]|uniref:Uncharacterized protein n=1 Tax=Trapa incisa TaxID=236973 RepID=A0AAN7H208_9MYRT|nr:hypothetical protein SAY87_026004 [Trapa incisa]
MGSARELEKGWNFATNWSITGGSLGDSVTVESSASPMDEAAVVEAPQSPLVLSPPPSAAPGPCEITVKFPQRYEMRQVYIRSTSRVYEIYYSPKQLDDDEYLCTVRCGVAVKDLAPDMCLTEESSPTCLRATKEGSDEERCKDDNSNSNDDEWVQVKDLNSAADSDGTTSFLLKKNYVNMDFYEATAEISDAEPCVSLTLRLLSIQSEGCVYVDEVYIFVDPVDPNSEIQEHKLENPTGNTLLSMLVPSLLQLSRSKGTNLLSEKGFVDSSSGQEQTRSGREMTNQEEISERPELHSSLMVNKQGVKSEVANTGYPVAEPVHQISQNPYIVKTSEAPYGQIETVLEQLISRVSRIEGLFMRFEENMLKPIRNIEARMQHVEQQLEALADKKFKTGEHSSKKFVAPEYSPSDSNTNSLYGNVSEHHDNGELGLDKQDILDKLVVPPEDDDPESSAQLHPCFKITAPDFSPDDDQEEDLMVETQAMTDSQNAKRQPVSIEDALASALAGFLSSTSIQPQECSQSPAVLRTSKFPNEDKSYEENASSRVQFDAAPDSSVSLNATDDMELSKISSSVSVNYEETIEEIGKETDGLGRPSNEESSSEAREMMDDAAKQVMESTSSYFIVPKADDGEAITETSSVLIPNDYDASKVLHQTESSFSFHREEEELEIKDSAHADTSASEVLKENSEKDILHDVLAISQSAHVLDFGTPILDVKFDLQPRGASKSLLESLFGNTSESDIAIPSVGVFEGPSFQHQNYLIETDDANRLEPAANSCFALDMEYSGLQVSLDPDFEKLQDDSICQRGEGSEGSLI